MRRLWYWEASDVTKAAKLMRVVSFPGLPDRAADRSWRRGIGAGACALAVLVTALPAAAQTVSARQPSREAQPATQPAATQPRTAQQPRPGAGVPATGPATQPASAPAAVAGPAEPLPLAAVAPTDVSRALARIEQLEAQQAELTGRVEQLEAENRALRNRLDTVQAGTAAAQTAAQSEPGSTLAATAPETGAAEESAAASETDAGGAASDPAADPAAEPDAVQDVPAEPAAPAFEIADEPAVVMIGSARLDLQRGDYLRAEARLVRMIELWPDAPETPEARWLLGESRFVTRAWGPATDAYVGYLRATPNGPRTPEVLLRLAATFRELGDARQRCLALERFGRAAPNPPPALAARAEAERARGTCPPAGT